MHNIKWQKECSHTLYSQVLTFQNIIDIRNIPNNVSN